MRLAGLVLAIAACSSSSSPAKPPQRDAAGAVTASAITDAEDAIDRFIAAWAAEIRSTMASHRDALIGSIDETMREKSARKRYSAKLEPCREASKTMVELIAATDYDFVLHGSIDAAHARAQCWHVTYSCCMKGDAGGLLAADTGQLLVVWRIPEG